MKIKSIIIFLSIYSILISFIIGYYLLFNNKSTGIHMGSSNLIGWEYKDKCPLKDSGSPLIFGPLIWPALHVIAENYPEKPNEEYKLHCYNFLKGLPYMLPCPYCGTHLLNEEIMRKGQSGDNLDINLKNAALSRDNLRDFLVEAHNNVSRHNNKEEWTNTDVENYYKKIPACIFNDSGWFDLKAGVKEKNPYDFNY